MPNESSQNLPSNIDTYTLGPPELKDWWRTLLTPDAKVNIVFLATAPIFFIIVWHTSSTGALKMLPPLVAICLVILLLLINSLSHRLRHVLEITKSGTGLEIRSLFFHKKIYWQDILDFFPIQDGQFLLLTKNDEFFFSGNLVKSSDLIQHIQNHIAQSTVSYDWSYRIPQTFFDSARNAMVAIILACLSSFYSSASTAQQTYKIWDYYPLVFFFILCYLMWVKAYKTPSLIRASNTNLFLRVGCCYQHFTWEQIKSIRNLTCNLFFIRSDSGWFFLHTGLIAQKNDLNNLLHTHQEKLLISPDKSKID